ncbi:MAG: acyltransferase [Maritimibacter sp.]|nr:acyltransferase [Maritimibacter sp.]
MREDWIDKARGIGIILVVFGHAWRGIAESGLAIPAGLYEGVDRTIYAFHMPLFFLLSGMFLERIIARTDVPQYFVSRLVRLIWPLFLWTWLFFGFKLLAGSHQNTPLSGADFPFFPLPPLLHFWFLWALFLIQILVGVLAKAAGPLSRTTAFWSGLLVLTVAAASWVNIPGALIPWLGAALESAPYVVVGVVLARMQRLPARPAWGLLAAAVFVAAIAYALTTGTTRLEHSLVTILAIVALTLAIHVADSSSGAFRNARWLAHLGRVSMAIYLGHTIFSAAFRSLLLGVGIDQVWIVLAVAVAVGLAGPVALDWIARRLGVARLLGF